MNALSHSQRIPSLGLWLIGVAAPWLGNALTQAQQPPVQPGGLQSEAQGLDQTSPLGARQQRIKRLLNDLETKFAELAAKLNEEQPDQAAKLEEAFKQSKEMLLMQRMDEITTLLDATKLETATDEQNAIISDLKGLIDLLLYEESEYERLQKKIAQLEAWREALDDLIEEETELKEESDSLSDPEEAIRNLDNQIARAKDLIKRQEELVEKSENLKPGDVDASDDLADAQAELREETESFSESMSPGESQANQENAQSQSAQQKASESLNQAAESQQKAESQLGQGKSKEATQSEKQAVQDMEQALQALEDEKKRLQERNAEEASEKLAQNQSETAAETEALGNEMSQESESQAGEPNPAESVQNAQQQMQQAAQQLGQNQSGEASQNQEQAIEELDQARQEVERQLNELRDQMQQEQIAKLEEVFKKMLERQRNVTGATKAIAESRGSDENRLRRADRIELRKWAKEERELETAAQQAEELLVDDGTSIVFRDIVGYLQLEIGSVAQLMEKQQTGAYVQEAHFEIETTLEELIAALENSGAGQQPGQQPPGQQPPGQPGGQQRQSLFPPLAEIKLLKFTQERINRRTKALERAQGAADPEVQAILEGRYKDAAQMQDQLTNMTRQLASRIQPTMTQEDPNAID